MSSKIQYIDVEGYIDVLDLDEELAELEEASLEKLRGIKNTIGSLYLHLKKLNSQEKYFTKDQTTKYNELKDYMNLHYPVNDVTDKVKEINQRIRKKAGDDYNVIVRKNNRLLISEIYVSKVEEMFKKFQTYNHKEYMNEIVVCECGRITARKNMSKHRKTDIHLRDLKKIEMKKNENNDSIE
jgi:hypothetical protein